VAHTTALYGDCVSERPNCQCMKLRRVCFIMFYISILVHLFILIYAWGRYPGMLWVRSDGWSRESYFWTCMDGVYSLSQSGREVKSQFVTFISSFLRICARPLVCSTQEVQAAPAPWVVGMAGAGSLIPFPGHRAAFANSQ